MVRRLSFQAKHMGREAKIHYVCRDKVKGVPHHAKAGNINNCLLKGRVRGLWLWQGGLCSPASIFAVPGRGCVGLLWQTNPLRCSLWTAASKATLCSPSRPRTNPFLSPCCCQRTQATGDYVLVLDCDMIASPRILHATIGHLYMKSPGTAQSGDEDQVTWVYKPRTAFIQTPQGEQPVMLAVGPAEAHLQAK